MQTQILLFIVVLFSFFTTIKAQPLTQTEIDSLKIVWNNTKLPDTTRLQAIKKISDGYYFTNPDSSFYFAQLQYDLAEVTGHKKWMAMALNIQAGNKFLKGEYDQALEYFSLCINIFEEIGETKFIAKGMNNLGNVYVEKGNLEKALDYFLRSLKMFEELQDKENIGSVLSNIGRIYLKQGNLDEALIYLNKSRKTCKEAKDLNGQASAQNIIGTIYEQQGDLEQALEIFTQNLELYKKIGFKQAIAVTLLNIGGIYKKNGDYEKALENYIIALETFEEIGNTAGIAAGSRIIGDFYMDQKNYPLALEYLNRSLTISEETGSKEGISMALAVIAGIYEAQGDYAKAISFGTRALPLFQEMGDMLWTNAISEHLLISYRATGQYKEALEMADLYMETKDSLNSQENQKAIIQTQVQSEYDKQKAIDDIENEKRVAIEKQKKENQQIFSAAIGLGFLLVIILAIGLWHRNRFIKKTNTALAIAKDRAETSEKYKKQFLANMSHEIRTPMHAISGMIKILQRNEHPPAQDVYLNAMKTSSENLVVILNDVLDLSKIEAGKLEIEHIPMNPAFVIENVIQILKYKAEEKGLKLSYTVANDVPSLVMGDPTRLNQILVNLCGNAIKFTEKGKVDISLHIENEQLHFQINDTGIGIPKSEQNIIFTAFKQAKESTARFYGGTGLGLSISKQLVELQHGRIWLESTEGTGSTFYVTFPLIIAEARSTVHELYSEAELLSMATSLDGIHVLIAEDNPFNQMIAQDDLSYYIKDITIDLVDNGALAVEKFKSHQYDLILMDVQMPEMNGIVATEKIREIENSGDKASAIPIIAMTASLLKTEIETCLLSGMDNYIPKPYTPIELIGPIYKALRA